MRKKKKQLEDALTRIGEAAVESGVTFEKLLHVEDEPKPQEEWVWVDGYKGTDKDMKCRDFQYELHKVYDMPEDAEIVECSSGFHLCLEKEHVFRFYDIGKGNRFFKVKALVCRSDYESYGKMEDPFFAPPAQARR